MGDQFDVGQLAAVRSAFNLIGHFGEVRAVPPLGTDEYIFVVPPSDIVRRRGDLAQVLTQILQRKVWVVEDSDRVPDTVPFPLDDAMGAVPDAASHRDLDRHTLEMLTRLGIAERVPEPKALRQGTRLATLRETPVGVLTQWRAPFTGGVDGLLPAGVVVSVIEGPMPDATAVGCRPENYERLELLLVPEHDRLAPKYDGYYLVIDFDVVVSSFCLLD